MPNEDIRTRIYRIRGHQVMLDSDLAKLYFVETKALNQAVKRNGDRFPIEFCFRLTETEFEILRSQITVSVNESPLRSQIVTIKNKRGHHRKYLPYVFTEQGVAMLSSVLHSKTAVKMSVEIIKAFVEMRHFISSNAILFQRLDLVENK